MIAKTSVQVQEIKSMATGITPKNKENKTDKTAYEITWKGKRSETEVLKTKVSEYEVICEFNKESDRFGDIYWGDNSDTLSTLLNDDKAYKNVKLVYIDPPYATNMLFKSRNQRLAYDDCLTGVSYLNFMRDRLIFLREILSEDGSIYVHLDQNMVFEIKLIMDEIFGRNNFQNFITRRKCSRKNYTKNRYGNISDHILFYTKDSNYYWDRSYESWDEESMKKEYPCIEENTGRRFKKVPIHAPGIRNGATGGKWKGMSPPPGKHWQYTPEKLDAMDRRGEIYWSKNGNPRRKVYFDQSPGLAVQDIWEDVRDNVNQNMKITGYPTEKNPALLRRIINASSKPNDLILDAFCGSGTTLGVAERLNRSWIGIDESEEAINACVKRFSEGLTKMGDYVTSRNDKQRDLFFDNSEVEKSHLNSNFRLIKDVEIEADPKLLAKWKKTLKRYHG